MPEIQAIIFDLGGVILDIDYQRTVNAFKALGHDRFDELYSQMKQSDLFDDLETGLMTPDDFIQKLNAQIPHATSSEIEKAWNAIILDYPAGRLDFVSQVRNRMPGFLLSNTNEIHTNFYNALLPEGKSIHDYFDKAYLSHEIGARKPDEDAFYMILDEQHLDPSETLFIDDSPQHIAAAGDLGIQTLHLKDIRQLENELRPFLA